MIYRDPSGIWLITELLDEGEEIINEIVSFGCNIVNETKIQCAEAEAEYEARKAEHMANVYASYATPDMQAALAIDSTVGLPAIYNYFVSPLRYSAQGSEHPFIDTFKNRKDNTTYFYLGAEELLFEVTDTIKNPELIKSRALGTVIAVIENPELLKPDLIGAAVDAWNFVWYSPDKEFFGTSSKVAVGVGASVILAEAKSWLPKNCGKVDLSDGDISRRATMSTIGSSPVPKSNKLALGLSDYLDEFATTNNAHTWKDFADPTNWKAGINDALFNPDMQIIVNLDGIDNPMLAVQRAASNIGGATDWELLQIKMTPSAWDRITWYKNGQEVPNPFE